MSDKKKEVEQGNGSLRAPYVTAKGEKKVKWGFWVPFDFAVRFRSFSGNLPLGTSASDWAIKVLEEAIEREQRKKKAG